MGFRARRAAEDKYSRVKILGEYEKLLCGPAEGRASLESAGVLS
jgi:hypothetical protein